MLQLLVATFLQCVSVGLRLSFEQAECLHRHQQQHPCTPCSSICASAPECKSPLAQSETAKKSGTSNSRQGGDVSPYFISDSIHSELLTFSHPLSRLSPFWRAINGFTLIWRASGTVCWSGGFFAVVVAVNNEKKKKNRKNRKRVMFSLHGVRQFRVLSALVVGSIVCCAKRWVLLSFWEVKVIARRWLKVMFPSCFLLSFQRQWTEQHVFREGDGG